MVPQLCTFPASSTYEGSGLQGLALTSPHGHRASLSNVAFRHRLSGRAQLATVATAHFQNPKWPRQAPHGIIATPARIVFKRMAYEEYAASFRIGMVERHETTPSSARPHDDARKNSLSPSAVGPMVHHEDNPSSVFAYSTGQAGIPSTIDRSLGRGLMSDPPPPTRRPRIVGLGAMQIIQGSHRGPPDQPHSSFRRRRNIISLR